MPSPRLTQAPPPKDIPSEVKVSSSDAQLLKYEAKKISESTRKVIGMLNSSGLKSADQVDDLLDVVQRFDFVKKLNNLENQQAATADSNQKKKLKSTDTENETLKSMV